MVWLAVFICLLYLPLMSIVLAALSKSRFFVFPVRAYTTQWFQQAWESQQAWGSMATSAIVAVIVSVIATIIALLGALAFARYSWRGRNFFQKLILIPIFFPQTVLGLALQIWFSWIGIHHSWHSSIIAHLVWISPIVTLVIAIQVYGFDTALEDAARDLGAGRWQIFKDVTFPLLGPGIFAGWLFALLLSWGNFAMSYFTNGADVSSPEWIYGKLIGGYTPIVPAVGVFTVLIGAVTLIVGLVINDRLQRSRE